MNTVANVGNALERVGEAIGRILEPPAPTHRIEAEDVQGLVFRGYGSLTACCYPLLRVRDRTEARVFLRGLVADIARGKPAAGNVAVQIAFTHAGMAAFGLSGEALQAFSREFIEGMVGEHRSRFLGDVRESAPACWQWGGPRNPPIHVLLMLFADADERLGQLVANMRSRWAAGLEEIRTLATADLAGVEHFGFADGISQPAIEGYHPSTSSLHLVKPGEFLLGYPNEYGLLADRPLVNAAEDPTGLLPLDVQGSPQRDFGRNGTYLVVRQLRQHVAEFRAALDAQTRGPDGLADPNARERLAARMVGRWRNGAPLIESPDREDATKAKDNEFRYQREDPYGLKCPIGAHVRRANPRDSLAPQPGSDRSLAVNRRHRLIRRGRSYGKPLAEGATDDQDRGLIFIAVGANISRQFEFIQHSWIADPRFNGLYNEADPIAGATNNNDFSVPGDPVRTRYTGFAPFVTVSGGSYFFLPGIRALRFLAEGMP